MHMMMVMVRRMHMMMVMVRRWWHRSIVSIISVIHHICSILTYHIV
jgi:hypothetical protein